GAFCQSHSGFHPETAWKGNATRRIPCPRPWVRDLFEPFSVDDLPRAVKRLATGATDSVETSGEHVGRETVIGQSGSDVECGDAAGAKYALHFVGDAHDRPHSEMVPQHAAGIHQGIGFIG